jgi:adenylate kinase
MNKSIFFIGGIHGVGKTTLCQFLSDKLPLNHYSASDLIKKYTQIDFPKNKHIKDISGNQDILISALDEFLEPNENCILDGHFCLLNSAGEITKIPLSTYIEMKPKAIICLFDDVNVIYERLVGRDRHGHDIEMLEKFQSDEIEYSRQVADHLDVPYFSGNPISDRQQIRSFIEGIL